MVQIVRRRRETRRQQRRTRVRRLNQTYVHSQYVQWLIAKVYLALLSMVFTYCYADCQPEKQWFDFYFMNPKELFPQSVICGQKPQGFYILISFQVLIPPPIFFRPLVD